MRTATAEELREDGRLLEDILLEIGAGSYHCHVITSGPGGGKAQPGFAARVGDPALHRTALSAERETAEMADIKKQLEALQKEKDGGGTIETVLTSVGALLTGLTKGNDNGGSLSEGVKLAKEFAQQGLQTDDVIKVFQLAREMTPQGGNDDALSQFLPVLGQLVSAKMGAQAVPAGGLAGSDGKIGMADAAEVDQQALVNPIVQQWFNSLDNAAQAGDTQAVASLTLSGLNVAAELNLDDHEDLARFRENPGAAFDDVIIANVPSLEGDVAAGAREIVVREISEALADERAEGLRPDAIIDPSAETPA